MLDSCFLLQQDTRFSHVASISPLIRVWTEMWFVCWWLLLTQFPSEMWVIWSGLYEATPLQQAALSDWASRSFLTVRCSLHFCSNLTDTFHSLDFKRLFFFHKVSIFFIHFISFFNESPLGDFICTSVGRLSLLTVTYKPVSVDGFVCDTWFIITGEKCLHPVFSCSAS